MRLPGGVLASLALAFPAYAATWRWVSPQPTGANINALTRAGNAVLAVAGDGHLIWSEDGGVTWTYDARLLGHPLFSASCTDRTHCWLGGRGELIALDETTWEAIPLPDESSPVTSVFAGDEVLYVQSVLFTPGSAYKLRTSDRSALPLATPLAAVHPFALERATETRFWVGGQRASGALAVYATDDGGESWIDVTPSGLQGYRVRLKARDASTLVVGTTDYIRLFEGPWNGPLQKIQYSRVVSGLALWGGDETWVIDSSTAFGYGNGATFWFNKGPATWASWQGFSHPDLVATAVLATGPGAALGAGLGGTILGFTIGEPAPRVLVEGGLSAGLVRDLVFPTERVGYRVRWPSTPGGGGIDGTEDRGETWRTILPDVSQHFWLSERKGWGFNWARGFSYTEDGGASWVARGGPVVTSWGSFEFRNENEGLFLYRASDRTTWVLGFTTDGGQTWAAGQTPLAPSEQRAAPRFDARGVAWSVAPSGVIRSMDGGRTWTRIPGSPGGLRLLVHGGRVWVSSSGGGLVPPVPNSWVSDDDGATWSPVPMIPWEGGILSRRRMWSPAAQGEIWSSADGGQSWRREFVSGASDLTLWIDRHGAIGYATAAGEFRAGDINTPPALALTVPFGALARAPVRIEAATSDVDGDALSLTWRQVGGLPVDLTVDVASASFTTAIAGTREFTAEACDEVNACTTAAIAVEILENHPPVLSLAAPAPVSVGELVELEATVSEPDGQGFQVEWTVDREDVSLAASGARASFTAPPGPSEVGVTLRACDETGVCAEEEVVVVVLNSPPVAGIVAPVAGEEGSEVLLDASSSADPDGRPLRFSWWQEAGPALPLSSLDAAAVAARVPRLPGDAAVSFAVRACDVEDACAEARHELLLRDVLDDPPVVELDLPGTVPEQSRLPLHATVTDVDGDPFALEWTLVDGPGEVEGETYSTPQVLHDATSRVQAEACELGGGPCARADATLIVLDSINEPPIVDAGLDRHVRPATPVVLEGTGKDPNDEPLAFTWTQADGPVVDLAAEGARVTVPGVKPDDTAVIVVVLRACDPRGGCAEDDAAVTVDGLRQNRAPGVHLDGPRQAGDAFAFAASAADPEGDPVTFAWSVDERCPWPLDAQGVFAQVRVVAAGDCAITVRACDPYDACGQASARLSAGSQRPSQVRPASCGGCASTAGTSAWLALCSLIVNLRRRGGSRA